MSRDTECRKMFGDNKEISSARAEDSDGPAAALCQASPLLTGVEGDCPPLLRHTSRLSHPQPSPLLGPPLRRYLSKIQRPSVGLI